MSARRGHRRQYHLRGLFVCLGAAVIGLYFLLQLLGSGTLLDRYYMIRTHQQLENAYDILIASEPGDRSVIAEIEQRNISIALFDEETGQTVYSSRSQDWMRDPMLQLILTEIRDGLAETGKNPFFTTREPENITASGTEISMGSAVALCGSIGGELVELSVQLEPIQESSQIALHFTLIIGLLTMLATIVIFLCAARMVTRPIEQMTTAAKRIAARDFSQRCDDSDCIEISTLAQSVNTMSDQLQLYTGELQAANERLKADIAAIERGQRARKDLVANISHDLKTPIALISGYADGLASGMAKTPAQVREYCDVIIDETERMQSMLQRMLQLSRIESGGVVLTMEEFCLSDLLDDLLGLFRVEIERAGIKVERDYAPGLYVVSDYISAEQALTNYLQNAVQHIGTERQLRISVHSKPDGRLRVTVFNSAEPFSEEERAELWDSFYRGEKSRKRAGNRSGLGLAIVKGNMELLGEPFGVDNAPGGVAFWLELPEQK